VRHNINKRTHTRGVHVRGQRKWKRPCHVMTYPDGNTEVWLQQ
jgi:hypothetical protein